MAQKKADLTAHPLVARLKLSPSELTSLATVVGWIGDAESADRVRVYLDLSFATHYELARGDVVETAAVDPKDENSPSVVWVKSSARVDLVTAVRVTGEIGFISGDIQQRYLGRASQLAARRRMMIADENMVAADTTWSCPVPTLEGPCETRNIFCPTRPGMCPV